MIVVLIISVVLGLYAILIGAIILGWLQLPVFLDEKKDPTTTVSVIIAARNEQYRIQNMLSDLEKQDYPQQLLEIIVVDDHSDDDTARMVDDFLQLTEVRITFMRRSGQDAVGKKSAIEAGVLTAKGELIITTDADCHVGEQWVSSIARFYEHKHPEMILAPVAFMPAINLFGRMQELEFMSLQFTTAGAASIGKPMMANGANLAYRKQAFLEVGGYASNNRFPSGDDVFLMHTFSKQFGAETICYLPEKKAIVYTSPEMTVNGFISQRLRWVSKTRGLSSLVILIPALIVFFVNLITVACLLLIPLFSQAGYAFLACIIGKTLIDFPALWMVTGFFGRRKLLWMVPILEIVNSIYTVLIGLMGNLTTFKWKGRTHQIRESSG